MFVFEKIKAVVILGNPSGIFIQYLEKYETDKGFAWLFLNTNDRKIVIPFSSRAAKTISKNNKSKPTRMPPAIYGKSPFSLWVMIPYLKAGFNRLSLSLSL